MKTRFVLCITGMLLISSTVLAQTAKPDRTYPTNVQQTFSAALKGALKNYVVLYINDKHHVFVFQESRNAHDTAYFEDNGNGGCELFLDVEESIGGEFSSDSSFDLVVINELIANPGADSQEVVKKLEEQKKQDQEKIRKAVNKVKEDQEKIKEEFKALNN